jgi:hypothetical protein
VSCENVIAHLELGDACAHLIHNAGHIEPTPAGSLSGLPDAWGPAYGLPIDGIDASSAHRDPNLPGTGAQSRHVDHTGLRPTAVTGRPVAPRPTNIRHSNMQHYQLKSAYRIRWVDSSIA